MNTTLSKIAILNDRARQSLGNYCLTSGVQALPWPQLARLLQLVKSFSAFTPDNDPHAEHDFGEVVLDGDTYFWKIDYYDRTLTCGSPDPADEALTRRLLTLMQADEY
jgi:hypothetical protein